MDPPSTQRPRQYAVGDVINLVIDTIHFMKLTEARAVFAHASAEGAEIVLEGEPEMYHGRGSSEGDFEQRFSFVVMSEEVTVDHVPGVYRFSYVEFETASLRKIRPEKEKNIIIVEGSKELEIVADPDRLYVFSVVLDDEQIRPLAHGDILEQRLMDSQDPDEEEDEE